MMATLHLEDFIRGFAIGEGIVDSARAIFDDLEFVDVGVAVNAGLQRNGAPVEIWAPIMAGPSGCGLCGVSRSARDERDSILQPTHLPSQVALVRPAVCEIDKSFLSPIRCTCGRLVRYGRQHRH